MTKMERVYLSYLRQAWEGGLPPDNRKWDVPCPQFEKAAEELLRLGLIRRRWIFFGPVGITTKGLRSFGGLSAWVSR